MRKTTNCTTVLNRIKFKHQRLPFGTFSQLLKDKKIVSVKEFLQRPKLKEEWEFKNFKPARDYIASIWKGTF